MDSTTAEPLRLEIASIETEEPGGNKRARCFPSLACLVKNKKCVLQFLGALFFLFLCWAVVMREISNDGPFMSNTCEVRRPEGFSYEHVPDKGYGSGYRLGDMVHQKRMREFIGHGVKFHLENAPDSLASMYMRATDAQSAYKLLLDCIDRKMAAEGPADTDIHTHEDKSDTAVIHLRLGDVLDDETHAKYTVQDYLKDWLEWWPGTGYYYVAPAKMFSDPKHGLDLQGGKIKKVILMGNPYYRIPEDKEPTNGLAYVDAIEKIFRERGVEHVERRLAPRQKKEDLDKLSKKEKVIADAKNADADVMFFGSAKWGLAVFTGLSGFGRLLSEVAEAAGAEKIVFLKKRWHN